MTLLLFARTLLLFSLDSVTFASPYYHPEIIVLYEFGGSEALGFAIAYDVCRSCAEVFNIVAKLLLFFGLWSGIEVGGGGVILNSG